MLMYVFFCKLVANFLGQTVYIRFIERKIKKSCSLTFFHPRTNKEPVAGNCFHPNHSPQSCYITEKIRLLEMEILIFANFDFKKTTQYVWKVPELNSCKRYNRCHLSFNHGIMWLLQNFRLFGQFYLKFYLDMCIVFMLPDMSLQHETKYHQIFCSAWKIVCGYLFNDQGLFWQWSSVNMHMVEAV